MSTTFDVSQKIVDFICGFDGRRLESQIVKRLSCTVLDYVGVTMAGLDDPVARIARTYVDFEGGTPQATVWGNGTKTSIAMAAMANGVASHALDFDDTNPVMMAHPSIQMLPGLFALGEFLEVSGRRILEAYLVGFEVGAALGRAMNPGLVYNGWFPVGVLGVISQAAGAARLMGLDPQRTKMALGIACNMACGLRCNNGFMTKPLEAGRTAADGVTAALLASHGMTANPIAFQDKFGFLENFSSPEESAVQSALTLLGSDPLEILSSGVAYKLYPCCAGAHLPIEAVLAIVREHHLLPVEIERIEISIAAGVRYMLVHSNPQSLAQARFSLEYCVARAALDGKMGPEQFTEEKVMESEAASMMKRVVPEYYADTMTEDGTWPVEVRVITKGRRVLAVKIKLPKGTAENPVTQEDLLAKFQGCLETRITINEARALSQDLLGIDGLADITGLCRRLGAIPLQRA